MNYVQLFDLFGVPAKQIPSIPGSGAPTTATEGAVGCFYMDTDTGNLYKCTAVVDGVYTWVEAGNGVGLTEAQISALDGMFKIVAFTADPTDAYAAFKAAFTPSDSGGGEEEPNEPVTPEVTLSSISATYSGGDVAVGTAVTDLTGIVVTAHYSDGSTATVTGYTLSGEIAEGSNTITVSYSGKTTTFTVTGVVESVGLRGFQLTAHSDTTEWQYPAYNSALAKAMGNANWTTNIYTKKLFPAGTYYIRNLSHGAKVGQNYRMHTTTDADFFTNLNEGSATELTADAKTDTFTVGDTTSFVFVNSDGSHEMRTDGYNYSTATDSGYIVLQKFIIPDGQYGILHTGSVGTNINSSRYQEGYNTVFYDDPTANILVTEVYE